jgi:plastocyanin
MFDSARRWAAAAVALSAAAACSGGPDHAMSTSTPDGGQPVVAATGADGVQQITISSTNAFRFQPAAVKAHTGKLRVTLIDAGSYPHNLAVDALHFTSKTVSGGLGDNKTTFTLDFTHPGTYGFICTFHSSAGMRGEFVID